MRHNTTYSSHPNRASRAAHEKAKEQYPTYDTSLIVPKKSKKPKIIISIVVICVLLAAAVVIFMLLTSSRTLAEGKTAEVTINPGETSSQIADKMSESGVVENTFAFNFSVMQMGAGSSLKPGTYIFDGGMRVQDYVKILCDGPDNNLPTVLVSEGMRLSKIADAVEQATNGRISSEDFLEDSKDASVYADKYDFLKTAGKNSLEGFLFPKTYPIKNSDKSYDVICNMLDQFKEETSSLDLTYPSSCGLDWYGIVTLASIVEKESAKGLAPKVAGVFYNRINGGMALNSDATTAYEVGHDPTADEVHANTPYSTYTNYGLPPTPICSPGIECLKAVCNPEKSNDLYFYFYTDNNGELKYAFSETYEQHQAAINTY